MNMHGTAGASTAKPACLLALTLACGSLLADDGRRGIDIWPGGGIFAQVVDSAEWTTTLYFMNAEPTPIHVAMVFADDLGQPLRLPLTSGTTNAVVFTMEPNTTTVWETQGVGKLKQGAALVATCDRDCADSWAVFNHSKLLGYAVFRQRVAGRQDSEATVPMELPDKTAHLIFDNRAGFSTGVAILSGLADTISVTVRDHLGTVIATDTLRVDELQKQVFALADRYPSTAGKYGCIELRGSALVALGLRFNPNGSFTSSHSMVPVQ